MRILHVVGTLDPAYGGTQEAVKQLTSAESELGHEVEIVTLDETDAYFTDHEGIVVHALGPSLGKYHFNIGLIPWLLRDANRFDCVICHGIWDYGALAIWLASRVAHFPYFVFVHGALDPWFRHAYPLKHMKKWLYWPWAGYNVLRSATAVLYTSQDEKLLAPRTFGLFHANGVVVPYGVYAPEGEQQLQKEVFYDAFPALRGKHILLFMSRIHPKKGCDILVEAFARIAKEKQGLHLVIAGPDETNWEVSLRGRAQALRIGDRITWTGMLQDDLKWGAFHAASCFVLPSHSENFGRAIVEALACGVPVIITDKVNIWREIQEEGAGLVGEDTLPGTVKSLREWLALSEMDHARMKENAKKCFMKYFEIGSAVRTYVETIQSELQR